MANLSSKTGTVTTPVQAQISLANNSATSVQDMSAYESQEVTGFVYVDATTDLRCSFKVQVVKNGANVFEIAAVDLAGDDFSGAPLLSFSMSGSVLRVTLPNIAGFNAATSYLRYQLSAPYLGGNYPLTVSASQVAGDVSGVAVPAGYIGEVVETAVGPTAASSSNNPFNIGSVSIPAGRWKVEAVVFFAVGTIAGNTGFVVDLNTTSATLRTNKYILGLTNNGGQNGSAATYTLDVNSSSTTTVYLVGQYNFSSIGTSSMSGFIKYTRIA